MPDLDTLIAYYVQRLIYEYQKPRAQQTIAILAKQIIADGILWQIQEGFTVGSAIGKQLDILGKYIGLSRTIGDPAPLPFFGFVDYVGANPQNPNGLTDYTSNINDTVVFYQYNYNAQAATDLTDTAYAFMLLFKIGLNACDNTLYEIQTLLLDIFQGRVRVQDNADMSLTYYVGTNIPISITTLTAYLPKPMGVRIASIIAELPIVTDGGDHIVTDGGDTIVSTNA